MRFFFDYLRIVDNRIFLGMTPGQIFAVGLFALGIWMLVTRLKAARLAEESPNDTASKANQGDKPQKKAADEKPAPKKAKKKTAKKTNDDGASKGAKKRARKKGRKRR